MSKEPELLNIKKLFNDKGKYVIPIYQRNFAWKKAEIEQLIVDIADSYADSYEYKKDNDYYIGTLIVAERKSDSRDNYFEVIDGQQRLTALSILLSLVKNEYNEYKDKADISFYKQNLTFDSRKYSDKVLDDIYNNGDENIDKLDIGDNENASSIIDGYKICKTELDKIFKEKFKDIETNFFDYLFNKVKILRVSVLEDTDLNHYFEIMNSRGEQLEMHEILKARLLEKLDENDRNIFNLIWEACSNMEKYIQFGFKTDLREREGIFGDNLINKDKLYNISNISPQTSDNESNNKVSIIDILKNAKDNENNSVDDNKDEQERFNSVINFPNFLLHVLKIQEENEDKKIPLDDKRLLYTFDEILKDKEKIKLFGYNLLKVKFLFDKYVIKRNLEVDKWSLKQLKNSNYYNSFGKDDEEDEEIDNNEKDKDINEKILMLLSMFHVSYPAPTHKNWLYEVLKYLYNEFDNKKEINGKDYKDKLKEFAKERYKESSLNGNSEILDKGVYVPHFIFNYLDYLLWEKWKEEKEEFKTYLGENKDIEKKINNFKFTSGNSVEHYYPQNPLDGKYLDKVDNFGNLCLISASQNSKLSNNSPKAKKEHYLKRDIDSVKQAIMMSYEDWMDKEIIEHGNKMKELLNSQINITQ